MYESRGGAVHMGRPMKSRFAALQATCMRVGVTVTLWKSEKRKRSVVLPLTIRLSAKILVTGVLNLLDDFAESQGKGAVHGCADRVDLKGLSECVSWELG